MYATWKFWVAYVGVALILGGLFPYALVSCLHRLGNVLQNDEGKCNWLKITLFEQIFFIVERTSFFLIAALAGGRQATQLVFVWMGLKLASNWNRYQGDTKEEKYSRARGALSALAGSMVALGIAILGGIIASGRSLP